MTELLDQTTPSTVWANHNQEILTHGSTEMSGRHLKPNVQREYPKDALLVDDRTTGLTPQRVLRHEYPVLHCGALGPYHNAYL